MCLATVSSERDVRKHECDALQHERDALRHERDVMEELLAQRNAVLAARRASWRGSARPEAAALRFVGRLRRVRGEFCGGLHEPMRFESLSVN